MKQDPKELIGIGIYSVSEAHRLTGVSRDSIVRWMCGYQKKQGDKVVSKPALWKAEIGRYDDDAIALSFRDLMEIRFIDAFKKHGVSWTKIRAAAEFAEKELKDDHPFSTKRFQTDGKRIFAENAELLDLDTQNFQYALHEVIRQSFVKSIEFMGNIPSAWWVADNKHIIVDPQRNFGKPTLDKSGIQTLIIAKAIEAERDISAVARSYDITLAAARAAVNFEHRIAA